MNNKLKYIGLTLMMGAVISGCGGSSSGGSGSSGGGGNPTSLVVSPITIDNAGTVPITYANSSTTSVIYVHNNTSSTISGITYTSQINTNTNSTSGFMQKLLLSAKSLFGIKTNAGLFLSPSSLAVCASIPAGQSCPLIFNTPIIDNNTNHGSGLIVAKYSFSNKNYEFSQVLNYAVVQSNVQQGAIFNSGAVIHGFGNNIGYATVYLYGSGVDQVYTIDDITIDKPGVTITQGNIIGRQIQSNFVQAIEVSAQTGNLQNKNSIVGYGVNLTALSSLHGTHYSSVGALAVPTTTAGGILVSGVVPIVNSGLTTNPGGSLFIVNAGNQTATSLSASYSSGISAAGGGSCGATLAAGASCTINFTVTQAGGNGTITVNYAGATGYGPLVQDVLWYNGVGGALLQMYTSASPVTFNATETGTSTITVVNIGGFDLSSVSAPTPVTKAGSGSGVVSGLSCHAGGTNLPIGESCSYTLTISDSATDPNGSMLVNISGNYTNGGAMVYNRGILQPYVSNAFAASLSITPNPATMNVNGSGSESTLQTLTVSNSGPAVATIESSFLSSNPSYMTITGGTCTVGGTIAATSGSCTVIVKLGPRATSALESGTAVYNMLYHGGQTPNGTSVTDNINYTVQPNNQTLNMQTESAINSSGGTGAAGTPFIFQGSNTATKSIVLTYVNAGTNTITVTGESSSNSPIAWLFDTSSSTCYPTASLAVGATCTVVFRNVLNTNALAVSGGLGSSYSSNLIVPTMVFQDSIVGTQYVVQPTVPVGQIPGNVTSIAVTNQQATIANTLTESAGVARIVNSLANGTGYASFTVSSRFESYYTTFVASSGCVVTSTSNVGTQTCTMNPVGGVDIESVTYTINPFFIGAESMNVLWSFSAGSQTVSMTPIAAQVPLQ